MPLRKKTLSIIGGTLLALLLVLSLISRAILMAAVTEAESRDVHQDVERALDALATDLADLESIARDWAAWDDTYAFVESGDALYVESNLVGDTFDNLRLGAVLILHASGREVYAQGHDLQRHTPAPLPDGLRAALAPGSSLRQHAGPTGLHSGLLVLPQAPLLFVAQPILTSQGEGPARGTLVMARPLGAEEVERLSAIVHLPLTLDRLDAAAADADVQAARAVLTPDRPRLVRPLDERTVAGYALLEDVYGRPGLLLRVQVERTAYQQLQLSLRHFIASLLGVSLASGLIILLLLERLVLSRLARLSADVLGIGASGDLAARVAVAGRDELARLAAAINRMLEALQGSHRARLESEARYRGLFENAPDIIFTLGGDETLTSLNPAFERITGWPASHWLGRSWPDLIHPDDLPLARETFEQAARGEVPATCRLRVRSTSDGYWVGEFVTRPHVEDGRTAGAIGMVRDITARTQSEARMARLYAISRAAQSAPSLNDLYRSIHAILGELMPADNFLIALHDPVTDVIAFAYFVDQYDSPPPPRKAGRGLTEYVLRTGRPLLATPDVFDDLVRRGDVVLVGAPSVDWVGVPLKFEQRTIGVMVVQSYTEGIRFGPETVDLLTFVSNQIALAIVHKRSEEARNALLAAIPDLMFRFDRDGTFLDYNAPRHSDLLLPPEQFMGRRAPDVLPPPLGALARDAIERTLQTGQMQLRGYETAQDGQHRHWEIRTVQCGPDEVIAIIRDVTERVQAEVVLAQHAREMAALYETSLEINSQRDLSALLHAVVRRAAALLDVRMGGLYLMRPDGQSLELVVSHNFPRDYTGALLQLGEGVSGRVAQTGQPIAVEDYRAWEGQAPLYAQESFRRVLGVPLKVGQRLIGVINITDDQRAGPFDEHEVRLVSLFADQAAIAVENARLYQEAQHRLRRVQALHNIDTAISSSLELQLTLYVILDQITAQLRVDAATVLLFNPQTLALEYAGSRGLRTAAPPHAPLRLGQGLAGRAALERRLIADFAPGQAGASPLRDPSSPFGRFAAEEGVAAYCAVPLLAKGQVMGVIEVFHRAPLDPEPEWLDFLEALATQTAIAINNARLFEELQHSHLDLTLAYDSTLEGWARALEVDGRESRGHARRVTELTERLGRALGVADAELAHWRRGAVLHDTGKMGIPDSILLKPGPLTDDEWAIVRQHPQHARDMLSPIAYLRPALDIPYCHHEKWDGTGYPRGLRGEQIPLAARAFAVADVWDALCSDRPYRPAWAEDRVREYLREQAGKQFDPKVVEAFLSSQ